MLRLLGVRAHRIRAVERARHFVVVAWKHPPTVLPLYAWAARAVAWALSEELETVALDTTLVLPLTSRDRIRVLSDRSWQGCWPS